MCLLWIVHSFTLNRLRSAGICLSPRWVLPASGCLPNASPKPLGPLAKPGGLVVLGGGSHVPSVLPWFWHGRLQDGTPQCPQGRCKSQEHGSRIPWLHAPFAHIDLCCICPWFLTGACDRWTKHTSTSCFSWIQQCARHFEASCLSKGTQVKGWSSELLAPWVEKTLKENLQFIFKSVSFRETPKHTSSNEWII